MDRGIEIRAFKNGLETPGEVRGAGSGPALLPGSPGAAMHTARLQARPDPVLPAVPLSVPLSVPLPVPLSVPLSVPLPVLSGRAHPSRPVPVGAVEAECSLWECPCLKPECVSQGVGGRGTPS